MTLSDCLSPLERSGNLTLAFWDSRRSLENLTFTCFGAGMNWDSTCHFPWSLPYDNILQYFVLAFCPYRGILSDILPEKPLAFRMRVLLSFIWLLVVALSRNISCMLSGLFGRDIRHRILILKPESIWQTTTAKKKKNICNTRWEGRIRTRKIDLENYGRSRGINVEKK